MSMDSDDRRATSIIIEGGSPLDVAWSLPTWFVRNHVGIVALWETINRRSWRGNE